MDKAKLNSHAVNVSEPCEGNEKSAQNLCRPVKAVGTKGWSNGGPCQDSGKFGEICCIGNENGGFSWKGDKSGGFSQTGDEFGGFGRMGESTGGFWQTEGSDCGFNEFSNSIVDTGA